MTRLVVVGTALLAVGFVVGRSWQQAPVSAEGQGGGTPSGNGDVNGDGALNLTDAIYVLQHLFQGGPAPVPIEAAQPGPCALPATGQTAVCHPGDDASYHAGCPSEGRFADNGDGTVADKCTGLMWQKETAPGKYTWTGAIDYCETLDLAGHTDWRLPNLRELQSITDYGRINPSIDPVFGALTDWYWSSTPLATSPAFAWGVNLYGGSVLDTGGGMPPSFCVRAVRTVQPGE